MEYRVELARDTNDTVLVTFPDLPGTQTFGDDAPSALAHAHDAMVSMLEHLIRERRPVPLPRPGRGRRVAVPALMAAKIWLHNEMLAQNVTKAELGRRLHQHMPQIDRLFDVRHGSKLDQLEAAFAALGKRLEVTVVGTSKTRRVATDAKRTWTVGRRPKPPQTAAARRRAAQKRRTRVSDSPDVVRRRMDV